METRRASAYFAARAASRRWSRWSATKATATATAKGGPRAGALEDDAFNDEADDDGPPPPVPLWGPDSVPPETAAGPIGSLFFTWVKPLFSRASELHRTGRALEQSDLLPLPPIDHGDTVSADFEGGWKRDVEKKKLKKKATEEGEGDRKKNKATDEEAGEVAETKRMTETERLDSELTSRRAEARANVGHLNRALLKVMGRRLMIAGIIKFFNTCLQFSFPLILKAVLSFIEQTQWGEGSSPEGSHRYRGYWLSSLLFFAMAAKATTENAYFHMVYRCGYQSRVAVSTAVYSKALRLASSERRGTTLGELVNLMQVDATKIEMFVPQTHVLWDGMLQIVGYMTILYTLIGWPCFAGLAVMIVAGPVQGKIMGKLFGMNRFMVKHTDARVKTTNEALQGVRCVKMYTWESSFDREISKSRDEELGFLERAAYLRGFSRAYMGALPGIVAVVSFVVFAYGTGRPVEASTLFSALVAFDQLRFPLLFYPMALAQLAQARVSAGRVAAFLGMAEVHNAGGRYVREEIGGGDDGEGKGGGEIVVEGATVYWSDPSVPVSSQGEGEALDAASNHSSSKTKKTAQGGASSNRRLSRRRSSKSIKSANTADDEEQESAIISGKSSDEEEGGSVTLPSAILSDINLRVAPGELCAVVGRVGSGKSTLCSAILNETVLGGGYGGASGGDDVSGAGKGGGGRISVRGSVAYASQSAWILNGTLRDNILFGMPYDRERYEKVLDACQLTHDLAMLDDGDLTEIGERGINLSGGQKQRVSVARAAYSDADVIILDDPLSALDPEVAGRLFEECVVGFMRGKTRLLVTNQLQCLKRCDTVTALGDGRIIERGTYEDLMGAEGGEVQRLLKDLKESAAKEHEQHGHEGGEGERAKGTTEDEAVSEGAVETAEGRGEKSAASKDVNKKEKAAPDEPAEPAAKEAKALTAAEERNIGAVKLAVYRKYIKAGGGYLYFSFVYFAFILCAAVGLGTNVWVSVWTADSSYQRQSMGFYLGLYALTAVSLGFVTFLRSYLLARFGVHASRKLHRDLLESVLRAPMSFFDTTPSGRILSRFSKDMHSIDQELSEYFDFFLLCSLSVLVAAGTITFVTPWFGLAVVPIMIVYVRVLNYFREVARETKRLDSVSRSPVYAHFSETLGGLATVRAYGQSGRFVSEFLGKLDGNTRAYYCNKSADRWLSVRLEMIGALVAGLAAVFSSHVAISGTASGGNFASLAGLSLTSAISVTGLLNWCVRSFAQLEAGMNSCERVLHYTENIPREAPATSAELESRFATAAAASASKGGAGAGADGDGEDGDDPPSTLAVRAAGGKALYPEPEWPAQGSIELKDLRMRYRPETPLVLKGLNVSIAGGERIGVVGRTGSGKSSLLLNLMRIVEPEVVATTTSIEGGGDDEETGGGGGSYRPPIVIDGVDVLRVGLDDLRSKLGIIPQNPVLFSGTIRSNLDPFDEYQDSTIWSALDGCGMRSAVDAMPGGLEGPVAEYGDNLSQGQRQLLCLGRALLRKCRVLLLDEATSSVDFETDREIQRTLREAFAGSTVITIAHRVNTIMDSDKILVMRDGRVAEFAPPKELLSDEQSFFSEIVRHAQAEHD